MKKILAIIPLTLALGSLVGCQKADNSPYYIVSFNYNLENDKSNYLNMVVMKDGGVVTKPKDPEKEDVVFEAWYVDSGCTKEYKRWDLEIDSSFTLYAKWKNFEELTIKEKIEGFQADLAELSYNCANITQVRTAEIAWPAISGESVYYVNDKYIYKRYNDMLEETMFQYDDTAATQYTLYGVNQWYAEGTMFYNVYHDFDDGTNSTESSKAYDPTLKELYYSIDYLTMFRICEDYILYYSSKTLDPSTEYFEYAFTGNFTKLSKNTVSYSYQEAYLYSAYSATLGDFYTTAYTFSVGISLSNGRIVSRTDTVTGQTVVGQDEVYEIFQEQNTYDFYYNDSGYTDFTGTVYPHS